MSKSKAPQPAADRPKKVRIINLGCSKNQVDSESILGEFGRAGFTLAQEDDASQVTVINTCGFIEDAKDESIQEIGGCRLPFPTVSYRPFKRHS
jgi:ribosomal protein S12 methylthiotransferase